MLKFDEFATGKFHEKADGLFEDFKVKFQRKYKTTDEESKRREIFRESMKRVDKNNNINGSPVFGVTKYSDRTPEEFKTLLGFKHSESSEEPLKTRLSMTAVDSSSMPTQVNWATKRKTTPVKDQGQCGDCWAFSVAEQIESQWAMNGNGLWEFSPQQVAACTSSCDGCGGGFPTSGFKYVMNNKVGLTSAAYAPYVQSMITECLDMSCTYQCSNYNMTEVKEYSFLTGPYAKISGYDAATPPCTGACKNQNTEELAQYVATSGPVSIAVNAAVWSDYTGGVLSTAACGSMAYDSLDHAVQLVGYNADAKKPYWIVRNSWATNWGIDGYIHLEYPGNTCGLANFAYYVTIENSISDFK